MSRPPLTVQICPVTYENSTCRQERDHTGDFFGLAEPAHGYLGAEPVKYFVRDRGQHVGDDVSGRLRRPFRAMGYRHDESGYGARDRITRDSPLTLVTFMSPTLRSYYPAGTGQRSLVLRA